ncbi:UNVERIFIED_CONTAM: hypothetical protein FKN15_019924 [Acipenser sinensis]
MVAASVGAPTTQKMENIEELIARINLNTAAQLEKNKRWRLELGLPEQEPNELELLLQKWEQARDAPLSPAQATQLSPEPEGVELLSREPEGVELPSREPEGGQPREQEVPPPAIDKGKEVESPPPPPQQQPPLQSSPVLPGTVPCPWLLDTLPVCLDLPTLDLEPRSLHHRPQLYTWFPTLLYLNTQTSMGCCQTLLVLPLFAASLPRVIGHRYASPQVKTSARFCSLWFPVLRSLPGSARGTDPLSSPSVEEGENSRNRT